MAKTTKTPSVWKHVRVDPAEGERFDRILAALVAEIPIANEAALMRAALRIGLDQLEANPSLALQEGAKGSRRKAAT